MPFTITGSPVVGQTLHRADGTGWTVTGNWTRAGVNIARATAADYLLGAAAVPGPITFQGSNSPCKAPVLTVTTADGGTLPDVTYAAESTAVFAAMAAKGETVTNAKKYHIDRTIKRLKACGAWAVAAAAPAASRLYLFGRAAANGAELLNWFAPGTGDGTIAGAPNFIANRGHQFTTVSAAIRTGVTLLQVARDNVHMGVIPAVRLLPPCQPPTAALS